jgi:hypothetical protein
MLDLIPKYLRIIKHRKMKWTVQILNEGKYVYLDAEVIYSSPSIEKVKVSGKDRYIILQSDRPLQLTKKNKNGKINWKLIEGEIHYQSTIDKIIKAVEFYLKRTDLFNKRLLC